MVSVISPGTNDAIRLVILRQLLKRPVNTYFLYKSTQYNTWELEAELRLLVSEGIVFARDRKFFIRNQPYALRFVNQDRRFENENRKRI